MGASISFNQSHKSSISHNNRSHISGNKDINQERLHENIYYTQKPIQEVYAEVFDEAVNNYNEKQKRADRKIENYYEKIRKDEKTHEQRELVVAVGKKDDEIPWDDKKDVLDQYAKEFQERNPNLAVYNMTLHLDEANPHLHINYVPNFESAKGLSRRVGMDKALQQQGIEGKGTELIKNWRELETGRIEELCNQKIHDFERENVGSHKYMKVPQYKEFAENLSSLEKQKQEIVLESNKIAQIASEKRSEVKVLSEEYESTEKELKGLLSEIRDSREEFNSIKEKMLDVKTSETQLNKINITEQKNLFGKATGTVEIEKNDWLKVKELASLTETFKKENRSLENENKTLQLKNDRLGRQVRELSDKNHGLKKENQKIQNELTIRNRLYSYAKQFLQKFNLLDKFVEAVQKTEKQREQEQVKQRQKEQERGR